MSKPQKEKLHAEFNHNAYLYAKDFANRWMQKVGKRRNKKSEVFDRFIATYVSYAALVNVIKPQTCRNGNDKEYCTEIMATFIIDRSANIATLIDKLNSVAIQLANVIETNHLSVVSSKGYNPNLLMNWNNGDSKTKLLSLLQTLYFLRCNLFHGAKEYDVDQINLLTNASECAKIINKEILAIYSSMYLLS